MEFDFIVIGAGMAGMSAAAALSRSARVALVERESQPGYHTTGRSAALFSEFYGNAPVRALTRGSRSFYFDPPAGFASTPLVNPRDTLYFARRGEEDALAAYAASLGAHAHPVRLDIAQVHALVPAFQRGYLGGGVLEPGSADIDVAAVLQGYAAQCRRGQVHFAYDSPVEGLQRSANGWSVRTPSGTYTAPVVVNASGAWGDAVARLAGVAPVGLVAKRRTAMRLEAPGGAPTQRWPAAIHVGETFYFKPDAGLLLLSPADETASEPCDAQPDELDVATAVDRFEQATGAPVRRLLGTWAGLRTFAPDKTPVVGFDPAAPGFFWLVGQGGYGIQTAPAMARTAAALALGQGVPADLVAQGLQAGALSPARFSTRRN
jgi:D-arginine dehydrogenase